MAPVPCIPFRFWYNSSCINLMQIASQVGEYDSGRESGKGTDREAFARGLPAIGSAGEARKAECQRAGGLPYRAWVGADARGHRGEPAAAHRPSGPTPSARPEADRAGRQSQPDPSAGTARAAMSGGSGHVRRRSPGTWQIMLEVGRDEKGTRKREVRTVKGTRREADKLLAEMVHQFEAGTLVVANKLVFRDFATRWLRDYALTNVSPT